MIHQKQRGMNTFVLSSLVLLMILVLAAGCSANPSGTSGDAQDTPTNADTSTEQPSEEASGPLEFSYWMNLDGSAAAVVKNIGEIEFYKEMERRTGAKVTFLHPPVGQAGEQFNMMMASRDYPDVIEYTWDSYPGGPAKAIEDGVIIRLNELIDQHAPNLKKIMDDNPNLKRQLMTANGDFYVFPSIA